MPPLPLTHQPIDPVRIPIPVQDSHQPLSVPPHPWLTQPLLFFSQLDLNTSDEALANGPLRPFRPVRISSLRHLPDQEGRVAGSVEFQTQEVAEKALATIAYPRLSVLVPPSQLPPSTANVLRARFFPPGTLSSHIYDLFRPFGPLESVRTVLYQLDQAVGISANIQYYYQQDADRAERAMNSIRIQGKMIKVSAVESAGPSEPPESRPQHQTPVGARTHSRLNPLAPVFTPSPQTTTRSSSQNLSAERIVTTDVALPAQLNPVNGPIVPVPGTNLRFAAAASTYIDPCNLFCKNLHPTIDSQGLHSIFEKYGRIVSARVITDEADRSREHGFVSFTSAEDAARALQHLNGTVVMSRRLCIRLHEPRPGKKDRLAKRLGVERSGYTSSADSSMSSQSYSSMGSPIGSVASSSNIPLPLIDGSHTPSARSGGSDPIVNSPARTPIDLAFLDSLDAEARGEYISKKLYSHIMGADAAQLGTVSGRDVFEYLDKLQLGDKIQLLIHDDLLAEAINDAKAQRSSPHLDDRITTGLGLEGTASPTGLTLSRSQNSPYLGPVPSSNSPVPSQATASPATPCLFAVERGGHSKASSEINVAGTSEEVKTNLSQGEGERTAVDHQSSTGLAAVSQEDYQNPNGRDQEKDQKHLEERIDSSQGGSNRDKYSYSVIQLAQMPFQKFLELVEQARSQSGCNGRDSSASPRISLPVIETTPQLRASVEALLEESVFSEPREERQRQKLEIVIYSKVKILLAISGFPRPRDKLAAKVTAALLDDGHPPSDEGDRNDSNHEAEAGTGSRKDSNGNGREEPQGQEGANGEPEDSKGKGKGKAKAIDDNQQITSREEHKSQIENRVNGKSKKLYPSGDDDPRKDEDDEDDQQTIKEVAPEEERVEQRRDYLRSLWCVAFLYEAIFRYRVVDLALKEGTTLAPDGREHGAMLSSIPASDL